MTKKTNEQLPSTTKIVGRPEHQAALEDLIRHITNSPIMAYPDFNLPYIVHTDSSEKGLGAVLYQQQGSQMRVISYASRTLTQSEKNYHMHSGKLEFLALKWAISDQFRDYLYYSPPFDVFADNNPLTYVLTTARLNATTLRWVGQLADFKLKIHYRPGKSNGDADALSRSPLDTTNYFSSCTEQSSPEEINAFINAAILVASGDTAWINSISDPDTILFATYHIPDEQTTRDDQQKFNVKDAQSKTTVWA